MAFTYISGSDDFLVSREGKRVFDALTKDLVDEYCKEIIDGTANKVEDVEKAVVNFRDAVQTLSMFGDKKVVWFKDVNFLQDSQTGRADGTKDQLALLQSTLEKLDPASVAVVISAPSADRRKSAAKWLEKHADEFILAGGSGDTAAAMLADLVQQECARLGVSIKAYAVQVLIAKVNGNTRMVLEEIRKLATYLGEGQEIRVEHISELVPSVQEGNFFEAAKAFEKGDLKLALEEISKYFFNMKDARPLLTTLQNNNRLLIQLQALADLGDIRAGGWLDKDTLGRLQSRYGGCFENSLADLEDEPVDINQDSGKAKKKTTKAKATVNTCNFLTQNPGKLGYLNKDSVGKRSLKSLIDFQLELVETFQQIIERPNEQEQVLRELAIRNLS